MPESAVKIESWEPGTAATLICYRSV